MGASRNRPRVGVVLFQLGGPDSLESVEPFLYNLFCDPEIFDLPLAFLFRKPVARWIATRRGAHVRERYRAIGGRSPIHPLTERQARALAAALEPQMDARIVIAMRYWRPFTSEAVAQLVTEMALQPLDAIVRLPLYPQYSYATTRSSFNEWDRRFASNSVPVRTVERFFDHPLYVEAVTERIAASLTHFDEPQSVHLVFSAHGIPEYYVRQGDPYQKETQATVSLVNQLGRRRASGPGAVAWPAAHTLCYQSRVGPLKWLGPSLHETIGQLGRAGTRHVLVCPISFVTEHIETLHEINIEAREEAHHMGIEQFEMMPAVGTSPKFIAALADLVRGAVNAQSGHVEIETAAR